MNDAALMRPIWATEGEHVTCINGHTVCSISRTIYVGDVRQGDHFKDWMQPEPDHGAGVAQIVCNECRGRWLRGNQRDGYQFHFNNGWR